MGKTTKVKVGIRSRLYKPRGRAGDYRAGGVYVLDRQEAESLIEAGVAYKIEDVEELVFAEPEVPLPESVVEYEKRYERDRMAAIRARRNAVEREAKASKLREEARMKKIAATSREVAIFKSKLEEEIAAKEDKK